MKEPLRPVSPIQKLVYLFQQPRKFFMRRFSCIIPRNVPKSTAFPHPTGIVISKHAKIGENCKIWQNVTIGNKKFEIEEFPVIGDNVVIYAGAVVIGNIKIGSNVTIGANSVVLQDVPDGALAIGNPARIIPNHSAANGINELPHSNGVQYPYEDLNGKPI